VPLAYESALLLDLELEAVQVSNVVHKGVQPAAEANLTGAVKCLAVQLQCGLNC
jgi:hypothetical protein